MSRNEEWLEAIHQLYIKQMNKHNYMYSESIKNQESAKYEREMKSAVMQDAPSPMLEQAVKDLNEAIDQIEANVTATTHYLNKLYANESNSSEEDKEIPLSGDFIGSLYLLVVKLNYIKARTESHVAKLRTLV
jgi:hypothetical protein